MVLFIRLLHENAQAERHLEMLWMYYAQSYKFSNFQRYNSDIPPFYLRRNNTQKLYIDILNTQPKQMYHV